MVVSAQTEKRLLWHPRRENKFIVGGGSQITLYEWAPAQQEIRHVISQLDLQFMKCFAWSPDPAFIDLVAVGMSTGKVDLMRLEATKHARNNTLSSGPTVSLPVRNSRSCNSLAFCAADPNYLAVGLDKVRGDSSLIIWDIHTASPSLSISPHFVFPSNSDHLRPQPQIPRADIGPRTDHRILQQHAATEIVSSLSFLPQSTYLLAAGISHRWLRLFDLRSPNPSTTNVASKVHGIATDPFDPHRIACFGDNTVTIWDARRLPSPLMTFTDKDASADGARLWARGVVQEIEFSSTRRGVLAVLQRDGSHVRFWDLLQARGTNTSDCTSDDEQSIERWREPSQSSRTPRLSWAHLPWAGGVANQNAMGEVQTSLYNVVLSDTRKTKIFSRSLASFALVPSPKHHPLTSNIMVVNNDGDLELYAVHDTPKQTSWSARGDLGIGLGISFRIIPGFQPESEPPVEPWDIPPSEQAREEASMRGATKYSPAPTFGKGDEDGFPALSVTVVGGVKNSSTALRVDKTRTYSPASLRTHQIETSDRHFGSGEGVSQVLDLNGDASVKSPHGESSRTRNHRVQSNRSASRGKKQTPKTINTIIEEDVSMTMRTRTIQGYGLGDPQRNWTVSLHVSPNETLSELWWWINHSRDLLSLPTPRINGFDFSYQGLQGIWEGFQALPLQVESDHTPRNMYLELPQEQIGLESSNPKSRATAGGHRGPSPEVHGDFQAAIATIGSRKGAEALMWRPTVTTTKVVQRSVALQLCGWSLKEEELNNAIKQWEKEGKHSRAACWLVFTRQYTKAVDLLMRSKDESHHMMSGTLAALIPYGSSGSPKSLELQQHCELLIVRLQDPYFRALLTHLTLGDWSEVLEEEALPFRERLAIAFQFLDDKAISSYLRRAIECSSTHGQLEGIIVTGLTTSGMNILQSYIDHTGDIQTATILASYVSPSKFSDPRVDRWLDGYRDLLDGFRLWHHRVNFDIERGQILQDAVQNRGMTPFQWAPRQILIRCNYCNKAISAPNVTAKQNDRPTACPNCGRSLPRCSICLMTLSVVQDAARGPQVSHSQQVTIDDAVVICQTCRHGGHASHILDWFFGEHGVRSHGTCAVADCDCRCADEF